MERGGIFYWILTIVAGAYILFTPKAFENKFHINYPDNLYIGSFFIIIGIIGLLWKFRKSS